MLLATKSVAFFESLNPLDGYQQTLQNWVRKNNFLTSSKILEAGCATGALSRYMSGLNHKLTGVDLSESVISIAQKK